MQLELQANQTSIGEGQGALATLTLTNNGSYVATNIQVDFSLTDGYGLLTDKYPEQTGVIDVIPGASSTVNIEVGLNTSQEAPAGTSVDVCLLFDASGSMGFSSGQVSKFRYGCFLAAALAYLMIKQRDAVGLLVFDNQIRSYIPPRSVGSHLSTILKELDSTQTSSGTQVKAVFHQLAERIITSKS